MYRAVKRNGGEVVAVKRVWLDSDEPQRAKALLAEIQYLCRCQCPYVTAYVGSYLKVGFIIPPISHRRFSWVDEGPNGKGNLLSIVMEYCGMGSLKRIMSKLGTPLREAEIAAVINQIVKALIYLHSQKLIHRDIKAEYVLLRLTQNCFVLFCFLTFWSFSSNILLNDQGEVKVGKSYLWASCFLAIWMLLLKSMCYLPADLGIAAALSHTMDRRCTATGTPYWMVIKLTKPEIFFENVTINFC